MMIEIGTLWYTEITDNTAIGDLTTTELVRITDAYKARQLPKIW